jgi:glucose-6-phosphate 1-epimerase
MNTPADLNRQFGIDQEVVIDAGPGGLPIVRVKNDHATASILLQGAHLLSWQPHDQDPVIWLSPEAKFAPGKSVRGGVPICWPWFGAHATEASFPAHGFARTVPWEVSASERCRDGVTRISFRLPMTDVTRVQWPHATPIETIITIGQALEVALVTRNAGAADVTIGEALHTYFAISDIKQVSVTGLDGRQYLDKVKDFARVKQSGPVRFTGETDRIYLDTGPDCVIEDPGLKRRIRIAASGSRSTVVWNPWIEKAEKMGDFGKDGWTRMVCVETANAADDVVRIPPGGEHRLTATYRIEKL